jgi:hypothetical protein
MDKDENAFVAAAIDLLEAWGGWGWKAKNIARAEEDDYYVDERHEIHEFFYLLWNDRGPGMDHVESFANGSGELGAPQLKIKITDAGSLRTAKDAVRFFLLLTSLMDKGQSIWNRKQR